MRLLAFSGRTAKEILRDPLNLFFGLGFPLRKFVEYNR